MTRPIPEHALRECRSFEHGHGICKDGFPVSAACMGIPCFSCGRFTDKLPACLDDSKMPAHFLDDRGMPRYARWNRCAEPAQGDNS